MRKLTAIFVVLLFALFSVGYSQFDFGQVSPNQLVIPSKTYIDTIEPLAEALVIVYGDKLTSSQLTLVRDAMARLHDESLTQEEINFFKVFIAIATPVLLEEVGDVVLDPEEAIMVLAGLNILKAAAIEGSFAADLIPIIKKQLNLTLE